MTALRGALAALLMLPLLAAAEAFTIVALGDQPYWGEWVSAPAYRHLIEQINAERPELSIHVGDFKDGITECSDALYQRRLDDFQRFDSALVYTPGDNDWTDCRRTHEDPLERLAALRKLFFGKALSLGRKPIAVERQGDLMAAHARYTENLRWSLLGVRFITIHTVGPDNNLADEPGPVLAEAQARDAANIAWLKAGFELARSEGAGAIVLATQGDPFRTQRGNTPWRIRTGFHALIGGTLLPLAARAGIPVLLIHGDSHRMIFDQPFISARNQPLPNLWRLEVPGDPRMHAVKLRIDPGSRTPFVAAELWNPLSPDPRP